MVTQNGKPMFTQVLFTLQHNIITGHLLLICFIYLCILNVWGFFYLDQVCVEGRLYLEFMFDDMMRIKTWHFSIRQHREILPRSILAMHVSSRLKRAVFIQV